MDDKMLLRDPKLFPSDQVLKGALGAALYSIMESFIETITGEEDSAVEWRYYNDGKSWLGKVVYRKKTVLWLSVIAALDISGTIKENFCKARPVGRLIPMIIDVNDKEQLNDVLTIVRFKKKLK